MNVFPINGLDVTGAGLCNPEGVQIMPGTAHGPHCPGSGNLTFDSDHLAVVGNGVTCEHQAMLEGLSFTVRSWNGHQTVFTITQVQEIADPTHPPSYLREGYRIVAADSNTSLCDLQKSNAVRTDLGTAASSSLTAIVSGSDPAELPSEYVVALPDPLYSAKVREISNDHRFFNLACASDALAKRSLEGIVQEVDPEDVHLAALRMLTATYCDRPRTVRNMKIHYTQARMATAAPPLKEAWWTSTRAMCIEHPRLEQLGDFSTVALGADLMPAGCAPDANGVSPCKTWSDWTAQVIAECQADGFSPLPATACDDNETDDDFRTYLPTDGGGFQFSRGAGSGYDRLRAADR